MNFRDALADTLRNVYCTSMDLADNFWSRVGIPGTPIRAPFRPRATLGYRLFCNREPPPPPENSPGGGQCPTLYNVTVQRTYQFTSGGSCPSFTDSQTLNGRLGPIRGVQPFKEGPDAGYYLLHAPQPGFPDGRSRVVVATDGSAIVCPSRVLGVSITSIVRVDGQPDDCGDLPPLVPIPPFPNPTIPDDVEYDDDNGDPITVPVNITFGFPFIFINGELNVPFRVQISPEFNFDIDGTLNLETGDVNFNFGGSPGGDGCLPKPPGDFAPIGDEPPTPDPGIPQPPPVDDDPTDDRLKDIIRGVIVTASVDDVNATIIGQDGNPDLYIPRIGNVQFAIQIRNSVSWTERVNVTNLRQFIPCPWEGGAIDVRGTAEPGVIMSLTPVIGQVSDRVRYEV